MIPGFVQLGVLAVLFQILVIAGCYGYLRWRRSTTNPESLTRARRVLAIGVVLIALGQLAGLGAIGSLRTAPLLPLRQAIFVQNAGLVASLLGYGFVVVGFALCRRASS